MSLFSSLSLLQNVVYGPDGHEQDNGRRYTSKEPSLSRRQSRSQAPLRSSSSVANLLQLARNPVGTVGEAFEDWYDGSTKPERRARQATEDRKQLLYVKMRMATTEDEWKVAAQELDELEGNNVWKRTLDSTEYDVALVKARLQQLEDARISCDVERMLFLIRTSLTRDLGEMGHLRMYRHSHIGTKDLIERYINTALATIDGLLSVSAKAKCDGLESKYILEQVLSARQAFGRSALLLSGGATFGMNHIGVLRALWEAHLLPRIISGASAGSIVCAVMCTRTDEEVPPLMESFCDGDLAVFEEEGNQDSALIKVVRFLKHGALYDIAHLTRVMRDLLGDLTFQEAYNRTRRILNICVSSAGLYELPRLLNYVTAPNVLIWSAVSASCSVPFIYTAASLLAKDPKSGEPVSWDPSPQRWIDGSVDNDIPMTRLAEMFNVNHFIVSQVNPHVVPFLTKEGKTPGQEDAPSSLITPGPGWLENLSQLAKGEAIHRMRTLAEIGVMPNLLTKTVSVLSQKYSGDITIFPEISYADFPRMLSNPTPEYMHLAMRSGQRATWPKLSVIKNHCAIELALDDAVQKLRARVVFSDEEIATRNLPVAHRPSLDLPPTSVSPFAVNSRHFAQESAPVVAHMTPIVHKAGSGSPASTHHVRRRPSKRSLALRHKKSLSINTVLVQSKSSGSHQTSRPSTADAANPTHQASSLHTRNRSRVNDDDDNSRSANRQQTLHDVTSSGAEEETSNLSTSSSSTSLDNEHELFSSPADSPSSPENTMAGNRVDTTPTRGSRSSLNTSKSQPTTPSTTHVPEFLSMSLASSSGAPLSATASLPARQQHQQHHQRDDVFVTRHHVHTLSGGRQRQQSQSSSQLQAQQQQLQQSQPSQSQQQPQQRRKRGKWGLMTSGGNSSRP